MRSDIDRFKRQVARIDLSGIDFAAFRDDPLPAPMLRCLRYMHDVEHHSVCYLPAAAGQRSRPGNGGLRENP